MECHNDPSKYSIHSHEQRSHLLHNKGKVTTEKGIHTPSPSPFMEQSPLIGIPRLIPGTPTPELMREIPSAIQFSNASGDIPLPFEESEESKKSVFSMKCESFGSQEKALQQLANFQASVKSVKENYLDEKLQQKGILSQYITHTESVEKYKTTAPYLKAKERCEKEQAAYEKKSTSRTAYHNSLRIESHTLVIGFEDILANIAAAPQENYDAELPIGDASIELGTVLILSKILLGVRESETLLVRVLRLHIEDLRGRSFLQWKLYLLPRNIGLHRETEAVFRVQIGQHSRAVRERQLLSKVLRCPFRSSTHHQ